MENDTFLNAIEDYEISKYKVRDLKPEDREYIKGMALMLDIVDAYSPQLHIGYNTIETIVKENIEEVKAEILSKMFCAIDKTLFEILDNDSYYWEN